MDPSELLSLDDAKALLAGLSDRALVAAVIRLREARGAKGYGADHARRTKAQKLYDAQQALTELYAHDLRATGALVLGEGASTFTLDSATPSMDAAPSYDEASAAEIEPAKPAPVAVLDSSTDALAAAKALIEALAQPKTAAVDENAVRSIVKDELLKVPARVIEVRVPERPAVTIKEHTHPAFDKALKLGAAGLNVLLVGPAGCGKSHMCEQVARALERPFASLSLTAGTTESALVGRLLPIGENGRFEYVESPTVKLYRTGGVILWDELDAADANMLLVTNSATANGHIEIEQRAASGLDTRVNRHKDTVIFGAANTFGHGADARYVGRSQLDAATLDRWYVLPMDYDLGFERSLFAGYGDQAERLGQWVWDLRANADKAGLSRIISTRMLQKALAALHVGYALEEVQRDMLNGWTEDERKAVAL